MTHNTVQGIEATTLVAAAVSFAIEGERDFLHLAVEFVRKLPQRGNWSAKASVLARVQYFMNWAETDGCRLNDNEFAAVLQRNCGTSVESNESVAAAFAIAARFFDDPTHALCFAASIGGDTDTIAAIAGAMLGRGMVCKVSTKPCLIRCFHNLLKIITLIWSALLRRYARYAMIVRLMMSISFDLQEP